VLVQKFLRNLWLKILIFENYHISLTGNPLLHILPSYPPLSIILINHSQSLYFTLSYQLGTNVYQRRDRSIQTDCVAFIAIILLMLAHNRSKPFS